MVMKIKQAFQTNLEVVPLSWESLVQDNLIC